NVLGGKLLGREPTGTMPHALVQVIGDQAKAWTLFDKTISKKVQRTALVDTFWDEKSESIKAFETLGKDLWGVRLDTPSSRRGDFRKIIEEVRWELNIRGGEKVKIIVSGRLTEDDMAQLGGLVDGFGVGTAVAYPPVIDFSAKIVAVKDKGKWQYRGKRGGLGGRKQVFRSEGYRDIVALEGKSAPRGHEALLKPLLKDGKITSRFKGIEELRSQTIKELKAVTKAEPSLGWV
ncbi:MAG: nicotinate phosphoribosyltransferase, partial [Thaumarchaeota archaeon]|nr:nicotinate phosphoribosyltransferase [Nitrososphaerota archaeon]